MPKKNMLPHISGWYWTKNNKLGKKYFMSRISLRKDGEKGIQMFYEDIRNFYPRIGLKDFLAEYPNTEFILIKPL